MPLTSVLLPMNRPHVFPVWWFQAFMFRHIAILAALLLAPSLPAVGFPRVLSSSGEDQRVWVAAVNAVPIGQDREGQGEGETDDTGALPDGTFAVVPFTNISRDVSDDWMGDGFAETVAADLAGSLGARVVGRDRVTAALRGDASVPIDSTDATRLGRRLGVRWVVTGGYQRVGQQLRITARLVDARTGDVADTLTVDGTLEAIFDLQDQIVKGLSTRVASSLSPPATGEGRVAVVSAEPSGDAGDLVLSPELPVQPAGEPFLTSAGGVASAGILAGRPSVTADFAMERPTVDGTLDDPIWQTATRITEFVQVAPVEGEPATEDTEVFVAFDSTHLYLGMHAHYSNPGIVRANRVDRDRASFSDDTISIYFDTFLDQQRAFVFSLNGYGVQGDSLMSGGGGSGGYRGGSSSVPRGDSSWDVLFDSGGVLVDDGWTAELAIPFKSLRYPSSATHRWGFQVARSIRGKDEVVVWAPVSRDVSGFMPQMGLLDGLRNLSTSRNLEILPTVTAIQAGSLDRSTGAFGEERQPEGGINFKYGLTPNLTLDFTYNPDFSQIESDRPQIEVNQRFPLFFSELRPFFLEGQEIFDIRGPVNFVNTRTIVDPRYGGKVTGKVGKTTVGLLFANDEAAGKLDDPTERGFGQSATTVIGRARYDLYSQSHVGAVFTDREFLGSYSRLVGVDSRFQVTPTASIDFAALTTQNRDLAGVKTSGPMFDGGYRSSGRNVSYNVSFYSIDPEFDSDVGFIRRRDIRRVSSSVGYRWWPESWLINWGPRLSYNRRYQFDGFLQEEDALAVNQAILRELEESIVKAEATPPAGPNVAVANVYSEPVEAMAWTLVITLPDTGLSDLAYHCFYSPGQPHDTGRDRDGRGRRHGFGSAGDV